MGVKQGCPLSPTLFGLYVVGLERHLLEIADIDAPTFRGVLVPLLLYADDLILMSIIAADCKSNWTLWQADVISVNLQLN